MASGVDHPIGDFLRIEPLRIRFDLVAQPLLGALHPDRDDADAPVIEIGHAGIEREQ